MEDVLEENPMSEIWIDIENLVGFFQVSNLGRVQSLPRMAYSRWGEGTYTVKGKIIKQFPDRDGYLRVVLWKDGVCTNFQVHVLVAKAFIPNPENKPQVNHKDTIKSHCWSENLEWSTAQEYMNHSILNGLTAKGEGHGNSKLAEADILRIRKMYKSGGFTQKQLARENGVTQTAVKKIVNRETWTHL